MDRNYHVAGINNKEFLSFPKKITIGKLHTFWSWNYFYVITTSALVDIIGSIEGNPLFFLPSFVSLTLPVRIAMVSTKYLCWTIDDVAAVYSLADLIRSGLFAHKRTSSMRNSNLQLVSCQYESFFQKKGIM